MTRQITPSQNQREQRASSSCLGYVTCNAKANSAPSAYLPTELGMRDTDVESIILKFLLNSGSHFGCEIAKHIRLPLSLILELLRRLKDERLVAYKQSGTCGDYLYELTELGGERAQALLETLHIFVPFLSPSTTILPVYMLSRFANETPRRVTFSGFSATFPCHQR